MTDFLHWLGLFHPLLIHFPIALLLSAAVIEGVRVVWKNEALESVVGVNLGIGVVLAGLAAGTGWARAGGMGFEPDLQSPLFWHRWLGVTTAVGSVLLAGLWSQRKRSLQWRRVSRAVLWVLAGVLVVTAHWGAVLVYGRDYFAG